ncbi:MAG TPA: hypothetical protein VEA78_09630, partial [Acidimicrobiales bacterium]|nr:hypothetical protein [Acidimicrobiales bacterium]
MRRLLLLTAPLLGLLLAVATPAEAATTVEEVAAELRESRVFVEPDAERTITDGEADELRSTIASKDEPVFVAVVGSSLGDIDGALVDIRVATGLQGTYAIVTDEGFRAASDTDPNASRLASAVFQRERGDGVFAVLDAFVDEVGVERTGAASPSVDGQSRDTASPLPLLLLGGGVVGAVVLMRRRRRTTDRRASEADRQLLRAELSVLADDVMQLEPQVAIHEAARGDYDAAVSRFRAAEAALDYADDAVDLVRVERVVREAQYAMSRARAIVEGREPPAPPEDLLRRGRHDEPPLELDEGGAPVYVGHPGAFYGGGWFGGGFGGGGLLSGLLLGQMLGGFGHHHGGDVYIDNGGDGGWGGDFGGGDFGG